MPIAEGNYSSGLLLQSALVIGHTPVHSPLPLAHLTGDMQGTATVSFDGERYVRASKAIMKMMGETSSTEDPIS
ncbi:MAG TPA: hypothetical protein VGA78_14040 [Gemmatimonadales bacterium]